MYEPLIPLHMIFGVAWAGAGLFLGLVLCPALVREPAAGRGGLGVLVKKVRTFMAASSGMAMVTGLLLLWVTGRFGEFWSAGTLLALLAFVILTAHEAYSGKATRQFREAVEASDEARLASIAQRFGRLSIAAAVLVILIMSGFALGHI